MSYKKLDFNNKRISDIRNFFEKKVRGSPELISYQKRRPTDKENNSDEDTVTVDLSAGGDTDCLVCLSAPSSPNIKMKKTTEILTNLTKAVGDVVGVTPIDSPARPTPSSFLTADVTNTPISEAASLTGDWGLQEQVLFSSEDPEDAIDNLQSIEVTEATDKNGAQVPYTGKFAVLGKNLMDDVNMDEAAASPAAEDGLPQRKKRAASTGTKRALPFNDDKVTPVKDGKSSKAAKKTTTSPASSKNSSRTNSPPTVVKKTQKTAPSTTVEGYCMAMIESFSEQINIMKQQLDYFTSNQISANNEMGARIVSLETYSTQQATISGVLEEKIKDHDVKIRKMEKHLSGSHQRAIELMERHNVLENDWLSWKGTYGQHKYEERKDDDSSSFFLGGIQPLRDFFGNQRADPAQVARDLLYATNSYCSMDRMVLADGHARQQKNRMQARAIIIVMRSPNHKREALIRIKRFLAQKQIREVSISDCFPNQSMDKARALARGDAVLQVLKDGDSFRDVEVTEEEIQQYYRAKDTEMETDQQQVGARNPRGLPTGARSKAASHPQKSLDPATGSNKQPLQRAQGGQGLPVPAVPQPGSTADAPEIQQQRLLQQLEYWKKKAGQAGRDRQRTRGGTPTGQRGRPASKDSSTRTWASSTDDFMDLRDDRN